MEKIAQFYKVSEEQFINDWRAATGSSIEEAKSVYANIRLPRRATKGSAGYDFFAPESFTLVPHETILIPTGIRVMIEDGWVLQLYPRSGLGFRHRLQLDNTVGVIDSDYFEAKNEGHILIKIAGAVLPCGKHLSILADRRGNHHFRLLRVHVLLQFPQRRRRTGLDDNRVLPCVKFLHLTDGGLCLP